MNRRDFLKLSAFTAAGATVLSGCASAPQRIPARVNMPENHPVDGEQWYASACGFCSAGCGIIVRTIEGRAKKIEGNPEHPVSRGALCARGQAGLQLLYNPDRLKWPLKRAGEKGQGRFEAIDWDQGTAEAVARLREAAGRGPGAVVFLTGPTSGHTGLIVDKFARALGGPGRVTLDPYSPGATQRYANRVVFGVDSLADYDLDNADYVLSFGASLLESGPSPVRYNRGYGQMHQGRPGRRGRLVQIEPRMSLTGANADLWLAVKPGTEGALALGIAHVILANNLQAPESGLPATDVAAWRTALAQYTPENVANITGIPAEQITRLARDFAAARPGLAFAGGAVLGYSNAASTLISVNALNLLAGNVGRPGGVRFAPPLPLADSLLAPPAAFRDVQTVFDNMRAGRVAAVVLYDTNPVFTLPALGAAEALANVPFVLSLSSFMDESTAYADLVLPDHTYLEKWDTRVPAGGTDQAVLTTMQPVVNPLYDTRAAADVLLAIARALGGTVAQALPWGSLDDLFRETAAQLQEADRGSVRGGSAAKVWQKVLQHGGWWDGAPGPSPLAPNRQATLAGLRFEQPRFEGDERTYPLRLQVYESAAFGDGRGANVPWLQELPDPMTTVVWGSWVEINPRTAERLRIAEGDSVLVASGQNEVIVPAYLSPGIAPDLVAMPIGQGHTNFGRYASGRGANPLVLLAPSVEPGAGGFAFSATRVTVVPHAGAARLVQHEGNSAKLPGKAFFE